MPDIIAPSTPDQYDMVRRLCWDYRDLLLKMGTRGRTIVENFYPQDKYTRLMARLETEHAPPTGAIRLALSDGAPIGCGMFHQLEPGIAEIKRVFVTEQARGTGAGRAIMQSLIDACQAQGFGMIRMDTGKPLQAATSLYLSMGFTLRDAYYQVPEIADGFLLFFEMSLGGCDP